MGSRVATTLKEGMYINLSLHYLEHVINCLRERQTRGAARVHVPYRNSMLTSYLRDRCVYMLW